MSVRARNAHRTLEGTSIREIRRCLGPNTTGQIYCALKLANPTGQFVPAV